MSRKLILLAAVPLLLAGPALAQSADQAPAGTGVETPPPPAASDTLPEPGTAPEADTMPEAGATMDDAAPADSAATDDPAASGTDAATPPAATAASDEVQILTEESPDQILVDQIVGMDVVDASGNKLGVVENVVLDKSGQVSGLVLAAGKILGMGGKTVAISWQDVAAVENAEAITVDLTEEQLTAAPEFRTEEEQLEEEMQNEPPTTDQMAPATPAPQ